MLQRNSIWLVAHAAVLLSTLGNAQAFDETKYPNLTGQWNRVVVRGVPGPPSFDQTKRNGLAQKAPLTPEYQTILEQSVADQRAGGQGNNTEHARCVAAGMPWMMIAFRPLEFIISPGVTHIIIADYDPLRRIFTDGRDWPIGQEPTFAGYSIGKWIDQDNDGKYDVLEVETRNFKGPRVYDYGAPRPDPRHTEIPRAFRAERPLISRHFPAQHFYTKATAQPVVRRRMWRHEELTHHAKATFIWKRSPSN